MTYSVDVVYTFNAQVSIEAENEQDAFNKLKQCSFNVGEGFMSPFEEGEITATIEPKGQGQIKSFVEEGVIIE